MSYVDLGLCGHPLRDMDGKIHSVLGNAPDGSIVDQSRKGKQIIQRCWYPDGHLVLSHFIIIGNCVKKARGDQTFFFPNQTH